ncbi:hypothetical protein MMC07_009489, partial [Pseudocyphellaria aurata]|nr:hypothetical protein [Pseudocyphellaria aurata]
AEEMSSPHSPPLSDQQILKVRQRSQTDALLPPSFSLLSAEVLSSPQPEKNKKAYTKERMQQSLAYCKKFLSRRDISPRAETFMTIFKEEIKKAMIAEKESERIAGAGSIRAFEMVIQRNDFLSAEVFKKTQEMHENLLELRELQYHARYGDYVRILPSKVRLHASENKTSSWEFLCSRFQWNEISTRLLRHRKFMETRRPIETAQDVADYNTQAAVDNACSELGIDSDLAVWSIIEYGARNRTFHSDIQSLIAEGAWRQLALIYSSDLEDIDCVFFELRTETDKRALKSIIRGEINRYFDTSEDPGDINVWVPSPAVLKEYKVAKAESGVTKAQKKTANIAENGCRSTEKVTRQQNQSAAQGSPSSASKKRLASTEVPRGSEEEKSKRNEHRRGQLVLQMAKLESQLKSCQKEIAKIDGDAKE